MREVGFPKLLVDSILYECKPGLRHHLHAMMANHYSNWHSGQCEYNDITVKS